MKTLSGLTQNSTSDALDKDINTALDEFMVHMCDDFNTPRAIASLFELVTKINSLKEGHLDVNLLSPSTFENLKKTFPEYINDVLGLIDENASGENDSALDGVMNLVLELRQEARANKDWGTADKIRDGLADSNIVVKDGKEGSSWTFN